MCGCGVHGVAACRAWHGEPVRVRSPRGLLGAAGCMAEGGGARVRAGSRERPGRARGAEAGRARPSNARGRAGAGQRRGRREREGKENRKRKRKMGKKRKGKDIYMLGGDRGVDRGCTRTCVGRAWRGGRRYAMRGTGKREERDSD